MRERFEPPGKEEITFSRLVSRSAQLGAQLGAYRGTQLGANIIADSASNIREAWKQLKNRDEYTSGLKSCRARKDNGENGEVWTQLLRTTVAA